MSSKRGLAGKRVALPRRSDHTKEFLKDWGRLQHAGINLASLKALVPPHLQAQQNTANARQYLRWLADAGYEPVMNVRHRYSAKWAWW